MVGNATSSPKEPDMKIGIVLGSIREERNGTSVAHWVRDNAATRGTRPSTSSTSRASTSRS
ncbi:hypothetical protein [Tessaracoccus coleopterorum]|uniref:hypothetical protein n=1 Tax=Tessaracoccus coleopterorum TaxID=2714950 RepID=UPI001E4F7302|nr:hypothetical protein [Tessaracoccus coleopterorum]